MIVGNGPENTRLNRREYLKGVLELRSLPQYVAIELTQGCNLACPMCRPAILGTRGRSMSEWVFGQAELLFATATMVDLRGWGESLLLRDVENKIERVSKYGCDIRFVTNLAFRRDVSELLADKSCFVAVSIDTVDPELYAHLRGGASWERTRRNVTSLVRAYEERGIVERLHLTTTVMKGALQGLGSVVEFAADVGIREVRLFAVTVEQGSALSLTGSEGKIDSALTEAAEAARQRGVNLVAGTRLGSMPAKDPHESACAHPWSYAVIGYDGSVGFCDHLIGPDGAPYVLGNLHDSSFGEIWNGDAWIALRETHLSTRDPTAPYFRECAWCYVNRYVDFEHYFHPGCRAGRRILA